MIPGYHIDENHGFIQQSLVPIKRLPLVNEVVDYPLLACQRLELIKDICGHPTTLLAYSHEQFALHCESDGIQTTNCQIGAPVDPFIGYDVATLYDVFEHLTEDEQRTLLSTLVCKHLVISAPWCHIELGREWFAAYRHLRPDEHLFHFNVGSLCSLLRIYNYVPVFVGNPEDNTRKVEGEWWPNILTVIFKRT